MKHSAEIEDLKAELAALERRMSSSRWLFRAFFRKIALAPYDASLRWKRSLRKRRQHRSLAASPERAQAETIRPDRPAPATPAVLASGSWAPALAGIHAEGGAAAKVLADMRDFQRSEEFAEIVNDAIELDPNIASVDLRQAGYLPPWFDEPYHGFREAADLLPSEPVRSVILVPFGKMGGADYVAGLLSKVLAKKGKTVILRTDLPDWDRPEWYAEAAETIDLSGVLAEVGDRRRALYCLLRVLNPAAVYNVNSRLCFDMLQEYGPQLAQQSEVYAYYFCADYTADGHEAGYPVWYMSDILPNLTAGLCDTSYLRGRLIERYQIPESSRHLLRTLYTPFAETPPETPLVETQIATSDQRDRPVIFWAGRLDRQKRFDLVQEIARRMPHIDFHAWGKAVLDAPPPLTGLPRNLTLHGAFKSYSELPLAACDGWLYTSAWDGLPTILIEIAGMGVPIVASSVGGVPELIDNATGWPVLAAGEPQAYVDALNDMLANPDERRNRALAGQARVQERHSLDAYARAVETAATP